MPEFSICFIILDIWQSFECALGIKYARVMNTLQYNYNNINIFVTVIILEFLFALFVHPGAPQLTILSFLTHVRTQK